MKAALLLPFILFASTVSAQQYQIPGAQQQPAWVFPMYFEDGFGYRDTVYLGYDPDAVSSFGIINNPIWNPDTVFAEVYQLIGQDSILNVSLSWGGESPGLCWGEFIECLADACHRLMGFDETYSLRNPGTYQHPKKM